MSKVTVVEAECTGCGICVASCPDAFEMQDDNKAHVKSDGPGSCDLSQAASECPVEAIKVE